MKLISALCSWFSIENQSTTRFSVVAIQLSIAKWRKLTRKKTSKRQQRYHFECNLFPFDITSQWKQNKDANIFIKVPFFAARLPSIFSDDAVSLPNWIVCVVKKFVLLALLVVRRTSFAMQMKMTFVALSLKSYFISSAGALNSRHFFFSSFLRFSTRRNVMQWVFCLNAAERSEINQIESSHSVLCCVRPKNRLHHRLRRRRHRSPCILAFIDFLLFASFSNHVNPFLKFSFLHILFHCRTNSNRFTVELFVLFYSFAHSIGFGLRSLGIAWSNKERWRHQTMFTRLVHSLCTIEIANCLYSLFCMMNYCRVNKELPTAMKLAFCCLRSTEMNSKLDAQTEPKDRRRRRRNCCLVINALCVHVNTQFTIRFFCCHKEMEKLATNGSISCTNRAN